MATAKKGMGRTKIEIKKIENERHLQVAFSKRHTGLFKKAIELATLCGIELVVVAFSPAGNPYSYGQSHVDTVIDRYLSNNELPDQDAALQLIDFHRSATMRELEEQYNDLKQQMDVLNKKGIEETMRVLAAVRDTDDRNDELEITEELNMEELEEVKGLMEDLHMKICRRYDEIMRTTQ